MTLEKKLELLAQLVLRARTFFDFWRVYESAETRPKYLPVMNRYSEFFRFDSHAQLVACTLYLCQIFENRPKTLNIWSAVTEAEEKNVSAACVDTARSALEGAVPIWKKLVIIRSNLFAHRSASLSYKEAFEKAKLKPKEIRCLTELGLKAVDSLRTEMGREAYQFPGAPEENLKRLLEEIDGNA